ncbi:MAG: DUF58 domain-containing protein [Aestuariivita sp.]|nr:DUF58 domain-containing protein [Aestuariivita sp.]MCY4201275.1 DUF58 domain-containing protein [Aestuariivita sp.]
MSTTQPSLRERAEIAAATLPPLLVQAQRLAGTILIGEHGRRRAGLGDDFWQFRPAEYGDNRRSIDHRRSASGDIDFVREKEWKIAQSLVFWVDQGASMRWTSRESNPQKVDRARLLALAIAILAVRGGERVGLAGDHSRPQRGNQQLNRMAQALSIDLPDDYAPPEHDLCTPYVRAVFISDFLGKIDKLQIALHKMAAQGVRGILLQILDPAEESFPYKGRTIFDSVAGSLSHKTLKASELSDRYVQRLAKRKDEVADLARQTGWRSGVHHTDKSARTALLWLYQALNANST